ncbi:alpha/beta hydrolase [Fimbriiglobus ruber]|uniref:AB hydrolase-1 domain-containing protein n=1 Tax=Fimbriiglobus ruber TaxID=1908690 RepID=A0A225E009_9BACT|nr:alpha/beta hydrolase [Fimbriiglobus ruber]OWK46882.1 hypothetical protein FRUB_00581 [Fimbriiglobus ruber]
MKWLENRLVFQPTTAETLWNPPPDNRIQDVWLTSRDGNKIHAWFLPHDGKSPDSRGAVLVSHGNGGNLSDGGDFLLHLAATLDRAVLIYDYPGYGRSSGSPSEEGCYAAADAAYDWLTGEQKFPPNRIVLYGGSLGGGVAVDLASRRDHAALVLVCTFTSLPAAAKVHHPWLPCHTLMSNRFDSLSKIGQCRRPVFMTHGTLDDIVPFDQGQQLFAAANEPKQFVPLEGLYHNVTLDTPVLVQLRKFLDEK